MNSEDVHRAILDVMKKETERIVDEEAEAAAIRVRDRVRGMAGEIATRTATFVHFQRLDKELRITVEIPKG